MQSLDQGVILELLFHQGTHWVTEGGGVHI